MPEPESAAPILRTSALSKRYGGQDVLRELSLEARAGEIYGFLGRNGAGKTTTIRIVMGMLAADEGRVELFGESVKRPTVAQKRSIGYVSQEQHFYGWMTCRRLGRFVAGFFPSWDDTEFARLLHLMDLPPERRVSALSHGMQVKLALALALAHRPRLLLLDEPTAGLDPAARREFLEIVSQQARHDGRTTFFSSHIVEEVERVADRIGILDRGRLAYEGGIEALRASVRALTVPAPGPGDVGEAEVPDLPPEFELLERTTRAGATRLVLRAPPDAWETAPFRESAAGLPLEDIFLAIAVGRVARE